MSILNSVKLLFAFILAFGFAGLMAQSGDPKPRIIVLTDIENEPDDAMSLVRFLTYSNQWDVEGLVAITSVHQQTEIAAWRIREILEAYGKVRDNLLKHEPGYPTADYLYSVVSEGIRDYGMNAVGKGMDSPGSELIIKAVDRDDPRPVWAFVWGGPNCLAQALWKVRNTRSDEELEKFVSKLRVYTISDQDDSGPWIRKTFPDLFYIASPGFHRYGGYHYATWSGISGDYFHARCPGGNYSLVENAWLDKHIRSKGPLGEQYPYMKFLMEGDSPSFMFLIDNGLGNPDHPDWGSWGGDMNSTSRNMKNGFWNLRPARCGQMRWMKYWGMTAGGIQAIMPPSGAGESIIKMTLPHGWTGPLRIMKKQTTHPLRNLIMKGISA